MNGKIILYDVFRERKLVNSNINKVLKIDESDICDVVKFSTSNPNYLGAGYRGKIKIWDIRNVIMQLF